ncbi:hypothetical protein [Nonomuraea gerenzanensis]|uniref:hypothetical protein n=1 Tax=Nonomuraea gerenzanensis TaxID=93944 RepID=UPI001CD9A93B|nr:hypothetical protein [Nonomuraea gerenzanensis]UBU16451.1 hypothetical protein LCN96_15975 [Nonomuraea gerenzanensis]
MFTPSPEELAHAIVAAGTRSKGGITSVTGQMVGLPFFAAAQRLIDTAAPTPRARPALP